MPGQPGRGHRPARPPAGERDAEGRDHYDLVKDYYRKHDVKDYDLGRYYDKEKDQLTDLFYKGDLTMLGRKALLFVPENDLKQLQKTLKEYRPFIERFRQTTNLVSLFTMINRQFRTAKPEQNEQTESMVRALPALQRIVTQATASLRRTGVPPSPGVTALFNPDEEAERQIYLTFAKGWGVTGNYHEYAYGPAFDRDGNLWVTLNCTMGTKHDPQDQWRGWSLKVKPDGSWEPVSGGFRSPSGLGGSRDMAAAARRTTLNVPTRLTWTTRANRSRLCGPSLPRTRAAGPMPAVWQTPAGGAPKMVTTTVLSGRATPATRPESPSDVRYVPSKRPRYWMSRSVIDAVSVSLRSSR